MRDFMTDCLFCAIKEEQIPARKIYEDDTVFAIMDISQVTSGHTLVIPKKHVRNIFDYDSELAANVFSRLPLIAKAIKAHNKEVKGVNILVNNEEVAYQTVFHSHIHVVPRYSSEDDFGLQFADHSDDYSDDELDAIKRQLIQAIEEETA